ncbi:MAG: TadE/TadG family type IV pilus assembly protein [Alphaproteobacteria bacterium]
MKHSNIIKEFKRSTSGVALMEFALILPVMSLLILATAEIASFAVQRQKLQSATFAMADYTTRSESVTIAMLNSFSSQVGQLMEPFDFNGSVVFSSVASLDDSSNNNADADVASTLNASLDATGPVLRGNRKEIGCYKGCVVWQHGSGSRIGHPGESATLPQNYNLAREQDVIVAEILYEYEPMLPGISDLLIPALEPQTIYTWAILKPRKQGGGLLNPPT